MNSFIIICQLRRETHRHFYCSNSSYFMRLIRQNKSRAIEVANRRKFLLSDRVEIGPLKVSLRRQVRQPFVSTNASRSFNSTNTTTASDTRCITYLKTMAWPQTFSDNVLPSDGDTFPDSLLNGSGSFVFNARDPVGPTLHFTRCTLYLSPTA